MWPSARLSRDLVTASLCIRASKPLWANKCRKQVDQQQAGYYARDQCEDFHDFLSNLVASGDAGKEKCKSYDSEY